MRSQVRRARGSVAIAAVVCALTHVSIASADKHPAGHSAARPAATASGPRAEDLFAASMDAYRRGDFKGAIELLEKVYAMDPEPSILYNMGRAYEGLGDLPKAIDHYKRFLDQSPHARDRGALEQRITTLERQLADRAALESQRDQERQRAEQEARERAAKEAELEKARKEAADAPPKRRSPMPFVLGGLGLVGVGVGAVFGVMASSSHSDALSERQQEKASDLDATANSQATIANIGFIAGGVLLATGVTWWLLDGKRKQTTGRASPSLHVGAAPGFVGAGGAF